MDNRANQYLAERGKLEGDKKSEKERVSSQNSTLAVSEIQSKGQFINRDSIDLIPLASKGAYPQDQGENTEEFLDVAVDTRGMSLEQFFMSLAEEVLGLDLFIGQGLDVSGAAPIVSLSAPVRRNKVIDLLLQTAELNGFYAEVVEKSLVLMPEMSFSSGVRIGIGGSRNDVPTGSDDILQIVPLKNDWSIEIDRLVSELSGVRLSRSDTRNAYVLRGNRRSILRSLQIIEALDLPSIVGSHITFIPVTFLSPGAAASQVQTLLSSEGVKSIVVTGPQSKIGSSILLLPINRLDGIIVFSADGNIVSRIKYWTGIIDIPDRDSERRYFTFRPRRIAAKDLLASFSLIFDEESSAPNDDSDLSMDSGASTTQAPKSSSAQSVITDEFRMVVDKNSGQIIIQSSELVYEKLIPILEKLDVSPRQVLLEVLIAEVSLKDEFRLGFEWALSNRGVKYSTVGGFGGTSFSGLSISLSKDKLLDGKIFSSDNLIRVLSSPTLLVKEGEQASVSVGSQISVVGQTSFDPLVGGQRQTTASEYLSTGVSVSFKPVLIGSDVIDLSIDQKISNTVSGTAGAGGNPDIFNRELKTEVLAQSNQTILLGGLISERASSDRSGIPFLSKIPVLGAGFGGQGSQRDRTELVMLVTPRVLTDPDGWSEVYDEFKSHLQALDQFKLMTEKKSMGAKVVP